MGDGGFHCIHELHEVQHGTCALCHVLPLNESDKSVPVLFLHGVGE
jgi:hypothetical protein